MSQSKTRNVSLLQWSMIQRNERLNIKIILYSWIRRLNIINMLMLYSVTQGFNIDSVKNLYTECFVLFKEISAFSYRTGVDLYSPKMPNLIEMSLFTKYFSLTWESNTMICGGGLRICYIRAPEEPEVLPWASKRNYKLKVSHADRMQ